MKKIALVLVVLLLSACAPSPAAIQAAITQTQAVWTAIPTQTPYPTYTPPTYSSSISVSITTATGAPVETPTVDPKTFIQIVPGSVTCNSDGTYMTIIGKVKNTSNDYDLQGIWMRGTAKKDDGTIVNTFSMLIDSDVLFRNTTSTFTIDVTNPNSIGTKCDVTVDDAQIK
jgi:hypothetical protein